MKRLPYYLLLFCITTLFARAQDPSSLGSWGPVGNCPITDATYAAVANGSLYVLHNITNARGGITSRAMSRWDGSSWELVTTFDYGGFVIYGFAAYRGELYLAGTANSINGIAGTAGIARWDGISWQPVGKGLEAELGVADPGIFTPLVEFDGKLVTEVYNRGNSYLVQWDGSRWKKFNTPPQFDATLLAAGSNRLYAGGRSGILEWDGARWKDISIGGVSDAHAMGIYRDELCVVSWDMFLRHEEVWHKIAKSTSSLLYPRLQLCEYDGQLFFSGNKGSNGYSYAIQKWDGREWSTYPASNGLVKVLIEYNGELYAGGNFTRIGSTPVLGMARLYTGKNSATISGTIFHDIDRNCTQGSGENGIAGRVIEILPGPFYATTNERGEYSCNLPPGEYTVTTAPVLYWNHSCNKESYPVHLKNMGDIAAGTDFPLVPEVNVRDVRVNLASGRARPGFSIDYTITYKNVGTMPASGTVRFFHDPVLTFESATPMYDRYSAGLAEWDFTDLPVGASRSIHVRMKIPQDITLGSELCARAEIDFQDIGVYEIDLRDSTCVEVTGSFDPNDIQVTPNGINDDGIIAETDSVLTYMIRFQNTGTDTAFKVVVVDTLAAGHAPASIRLGAASHPYSFKLNGSGVMTWTFNNIMLPDSNVNEQASHGYLKYSIRLRKGLKAGAEIPNRAGIYFDFNEPVITNTVVSIIAKKNAVGTTESGALSRMIYPNPSRGRVMIEAPVMQGAIIEVQNMLGQRVMQQTVTSNVEITTLDLSSLPGGTYTVLVPLGDGAYLTEKIALVR